LRSFVFDGSMSPSHYDVMLNLVREYQSLNGVQVEYRDSPPTALEFLRIVHSNRPVVFKGRPSLCLLISDSLSHWPALHKWTSPEYLLEVMQDQMISVAETPNGYAYCKLILQVIDLQIQLLMDISLNLTFIQCRSPKCLIGYYLVAIQNVRAAFVTFNHRTAIC
jgi:hypothetical protein